MVSENSLAPAQYLALSSRDSGVRWRLRLEEIGCSGTCGGGPVVVASPAHFQNFLRHFDGCGWSYLLVSQGLRGFKGFRRAAHASLGIPLYRSKEGHRSGTVDSLHPAKRVRTLIMPFYNSNKGNKTYMIMFTFYLVS